MTKEEYERLLKSDYWKGYSYSLIKERNFICEDCGRQFYNQRNKLHVHHLVYRDVNPWSYNPDEVVVLCEECHKKRHGLLSDTEHNTFYSQSPFGNNYGQFPFEEEADFPFDEDEEKYLFSIENNDESPFSSPNVDDFGNNRSPYPVEPEPRSGSKLKYVLYGVLLFVCIMIGRGLFNNQKLLNSNRPSYENKSNTSEEVTSDMSDEPKKAATKRTKPSKKMKTPRTTDKAVLEGTALSDSPVMSTAMETEQEITNVGNNKKSDEEYGRELTTSEILERRTHANVVKQAQRAGVSTEGSTSEILEKITHANVVKQAQRAGVSTEGSASDILERITHANVVKQAQRAGVSTEGSTSEILERITHANIVKQAQRAGVSTEGTTSEILERITRKNMEKHNY